MQIHHIIKTSSAILALSLATAGAQAAPITYSFTTGPVVGSGTPALVALLGVDSTVSGQFTYYSDTPLTGNTAALGLGGNAQLYAYSVKDISGAVNGHAFSDATGGIALSNNNPQPYPYLDTLQVGADLAPAEGSNIVPTTVPRNLVTFDIGEYRLNNVRLMFLSGVGGAADFLNDANLPAQLPTEITGRLALDFVLASDPTNAANSPYYNRTVFFDGLKLTQASPVPEPSSAALALVALASMGVVARRLRRKA